MAKIILTFDTLRSKALPRIASRDLIMKVAEEYGRDLAMNRPLPLRRSALILQPDFVTFMADGLAAGSGRF